MKVDFKRIDKATKKPVPGTDPCQKQGGWLNVPMVEKGYTVIHEFVPICGDLGRVLYNAEADQKDYFAIEIFCKNVFSEIIFCDSYQEVCEELSIIQYAILKIEES